MNYKTKIIKLKTDELLDRVLVLYVKTSRTQISISKKGECQ